MDTCIVQVCHIPVINSPLGHKIALLTSGFHVGRTTPTVYALVTGVGIQVPLGHARPGARGRRGCFSAVRSRTSCSIARAASTGSSCSQILTASQPAATSWVSRSRRAMPRNFRRHQLVLVLGR
jgi:hypothetical protein